MRASLTPHPHSGTAGRRKSAAAPAGEREPRAQELDEDDEALRVVTDADRDFINDEGVEPEERIDFGDDEDQVGTCTCQPCQVSLRP